MKIRYAVSVILMLLPVSSIWGQKVETKYDHGVDFQRYKTYAWKEPELATKQNKEFEKVIQQALVDAANAQLRAKGLTENQDSPDLYVTYSGGSSTKDSKAAAAYAPQDLRGYGVGQVWTSNAIPGSIPNVWVSTEGVLLFEVTDARTDSVVWSSLLRKKIDRSKMPKDLDKSAGEIAKKAFRDFPRKATGK